MDENALVTESGFKENIESKYLNSLYLELNDLKISEKVNQHRQRKLQALITMIKNR